MIGFVSRKKNSGCVYDALTSITGILLFILFAKSLYGQTSIPTTTNEINPPKLRFVRSASDGGIERVEVLDKKGKIRKSHKRVVEHGMRSVNKRIVGSKRHFVLRTYSYREVDSKEFKRVGRKIVEENDISVFDENGQLLFEKSKILHKPVLLNANEDRLVCVLDPPEPDFEVVGPNAHAELVIYSLDGNEIYRLSGSRFIRVAISPNGEWLVFLTSGEKSFVKVVNIKTNKIYFVPYSNNYSTYEGIEDDGRLYTIRYKWKRNEIVARVKKYLFSPRE